MLKSLSFSLINMGRCSSICKVPKPPPQQVNESAEHKHFEDPPTECPDLPPAFPFKLGPRIGKGRYSEVFQCFDQQTGAIYATKKSCICPGPRESQIPGIRSVIEKRVALRHPNIVQVYKVLVDPKDFTL